MPNLFLIHGLFLHGFAMRYLASKFKKNYRVHIFSYPTLKNNLFKNSELLTQFIKKHNQEKVANYFIGHSLGGLVIRQAYTINPSLFNGSIVTLGSPHNGSIVAKKLITSIHPKVIGKSFNNALDGNLPAWQGHIPLGSIAGTKNLGVNNVLRVLKSLSDGTVSVQETQLNNQADHICLPLTHNSLLLSKTVAYQANHFLKRNNFNHQLVQ